MRFVVVFALAATADFLWAGYISAVSGKQAARAAVWAMAIAIVSGVIAINYVHAPVLLVSLAAGSFVGTYLSVASECGKAIRHHFWVSEGEVKSACGKAVKVGEGLPGSREARSRKTDLDERHRTAPDEVLLPATRRAKTRV